MFQRNNGTQQLHILNGVTMKLMEKLGKIYLAAKKIRPLFLLDTFGEDPVHIKYRQCIYGCMFLWLAHNMCMLSYVSRRS